MIHWGNSAQPSGASIYVSQEVNTVRSVLWSMDGFSSGSWEANGNPTERLVGPDLSALPDLC